MERPEDNDPYTVEKHVNAAIWAAQGAAKFEGRSAGGIVIIGGGEVYRAALEADAVDVIHLSLVHHPEGWAHDVKFPDLNGSGWVRTESQEMPPEDGAPYGWCRGRLVRDPAHPALEVGA